MHDEVKTTDSSSTNSLPIPPPPSPENGKPEEGSKTSWFFSRMLQGMKNFWAKTETTTTTTSHTNDQMEYTNSSSGKSGEKGLSNGSSNKKLNNSKGSSGSSHDTVAYNSKETITPDPGISLLLLIIQSLTPL